MFGTELVKDAEKSGRHSTRADKCLRCQGKIMTDAMYVLLEYLLAFRYHGRISFLMDKILSRSVSMELFFHNLKSSYLGVITRPDKNLTQQ